jgi:hypothetical protein
MRSPVIIGATGGSGTRALREVLLRYGAHMGVHVGTAGDARDLVPFYDTWIDPTLRHTGRLDYRLDDLPAALREAALASLRGCLTAYRSRFADDGRPWGFKGPRSMYVLPYLHRLLPDLSFVHLVRDGRDMAVSRNRGQLRKHYDSLFGDSWGNDTDLAAARLWSKANLEVDAWCRANLPGRHLVVRYERLCARPAVELVPILNLLAWPWHPAQIAEMARAILPSPGIGRWRELPAARLESITAACGDALGHFGYLP